MTYTTSRRPKQIIDLTGQIFDRLTVKKYLGIRSHNAVWLCECSCGTLKPVLGCLLRKHLTQSCGCLQKERASQATRTHGKSRTPEHRVFCDARNRCNNPANQAYNNYGARGIEFRFESFETFLDEVGRRPTPQHTLERIENDGHYEKNNIKWATRAEQNRNKRNSRLMTMNGITMCQSEWAVKFRVKARLFSVRRSRNWCDPCILQPKDCIPCPHR